MKEYTRIRTRMSALDVSLGGYLQVKSDDQLLQLEFLYTA